MSDQKSRKFCGNGVQSGDFYINLSLKKSQVDQHWFEYNGEQYLRLTVGKNRKRPNTVRHILYGLMSITQKRTSLTTIRKPL